MMPVLQTAFLVAIGALAAILVLGVTVCIIKDIYNYKDLQRRLKKDHARKALTEKK